MFFDLDSSAIRDDARAALTTNATYLKRWPSVRFTVEGHCDERGTAEYNLGLGERRASAVRAYLAELGVAGDRVVIVSKGKEAPFCTESNESCWQQNRRGHFVVTAKYAADSACKVPRYTVTTATRRSSLPRRADWAHP